MCAAVLQFKTVNQKSYLNFVPVQIKTFIFTSLTIYTPQTHPSICRLISLENTCYSRFLLLSLVISKAADTNLHENSHFANLFTKRRIQLELSLLYGIKMLLKMTAGFCAFPALYVLLLPCYSCDGCSSWPLAELTTRVHGQQLLLGLAHKNPNSTLTAFSSPQHFFFFFILPLHTACFSLREIKKLSLDITSQHLCGVTALAKPL